MNTSSDVTAPDTTYVAGYSQIIPPTSSARRLRYRCRPARPRADDALPATALFCEAQPSEFAPAVSIPARSAGTNYHVHLRLDGSQSPGSSQIFNNHIPLDPELSGAVAISKKTPLINVTRGQLVPYVITVNNVAGLALTDVRIVDRFPAGFTYVEGSARLDGVPTEPTVAGRELAWSGLALATSAQHTVQLLLAVGAGVTEGEYVNRAQVVLTQSRAMRSPAKPRPPCASSRTPRSTARTSPARFSMTPIAMACRKTARLDCLACAS